LQLPLQLQAELQLPLQLQAESQLPLLLQDGLRMMKTMLRPLLSEVPQVKVHAVEVWVVDTLAPLEQMKAHLDEPQVVDMLVPLERMQMKDVLVLSERMQMEDLQALSELLQMMESDHLPFSRDNPYPPFGQENCLDLLATEKESRIHPDLELSQKLDAKKDHQKDSLCPPVAHPLTEVPKKQLSLLQTHCQSKLLPPDSHASIPRV
jgi:hypothetical protein